MLLHEELEEHVSRERLTEEPPDAEWLDAHAAERRAAWEADRPRRAAERRAARRREPLSRRIHSLEVRLVLSSGIAAGAIASSGGGSGPDSKLPPRAEATYGGEHPRELRRLFRLLEEVVERLERLAESDPQSPLEGEEIDAALVRDYEGYSAEDASRLEPLFGSPEAVRRARRAAGRKGEDGYNASIDH